MTPLPTYDEAIARILLRIDARVISAPDSMLRVESRSLADADGHLLAENVFADRDLPPFNRAQMDGYAIRHADLTTDHPIPVIGHIAAGEPPMIDAPVGTCVSIATGAAVPNGLDTVVQHEWTDRGDPVQFKRADCQRGHAIHPFGADARAGDPLLVGGTRLSPHHLGIAATVGVTALTVHARPRVTVLTSGDEVVPPESEVLSHQIRNSNGIQTVRLAHHFGATTIDHHHIPDVLDATTRAVNDAIEHADVVVSIGGVSAGDRDFFPTAFANADVDTIVHGVAMQPGKPVFIGMAPNGTIIVGLPGNPVSALVTGCLFLGPILKRMQFERNWLPRLTLPLTEPVKPNPRREAFRPAILEKDRTVRIPTWQGSGDLAHTVDTSGFVRLPVQSEPVEGGESVRFYPWPTTPLELFL
ncbi:MAG: molybdopterin molybdotransferase MoeA [Planctomycetota bacterium]